MDQKSFQEKVVIITGSSSGIGAAAALAFSRLGANVTLTSFDAENLELVKQQCEAEGKGQKKALVVVGDITNDEVVENIVKETIEAFGKIDVLVNNAGSAKFGTTKSTSMEDFDKLWTLLVRAPFYLTKLAIPHLSKTQGCIINTSSVLAERPNSEFAVYSMCKAALTNYTKSLAIDLAPKGVRAIAICPGYIDTNFYHNLGLNEEYLEIMKQIGVHSGLLQRGGRPEEVADLMVFLASDKASFMTGSSVNIDGGMAAKQPALKN